MNVKYCKKCCKNTERMASDGRCKPCRDTYTQKWQRKDRLCGTPLCKNMAFQQGSYCKQCSYESNLRNRYNVTLEDYAWIAYRQNFCYAVCQKPLDFSTKRGAVLDHCHRTGGTRGLLHSSCNTAIGLLGENPVTIDLAAAYLRSFNKTEV